MTNLNLSLTISIEKGATDRRSAPEIPSYKEVTARFLRTGRLLLCFYDLYNQFDDDADQRYQQSQNRNDNREDFICSHKQSPSLAYFCQSRFLCQQRASNLPLKRGLTAYRLKVAPSTSEDVPPTLYCKSDKKQDKRTYFRRKVIAAIIKSCCFYIFTRPFSVDSPKLYMWGPNST